MSPPGPRAHGHGRPFPSRRLRALFPTVNGLSLHSWVGCYARYALAATMVNYGQRYRFWNRWDVAAAPRMVYAVLARPIDYPIWWPQFRQVKRIDDRHYWMLVRSFLPYSLSYILAAEISDPARGLLQARVDGDIVGRIRWQIDPGRRGSVVYFEERVRTQVSLFPLLAPITRIAFDANHRVMMRDGLLGLRAFLGARSLSARALRDQLRRDGI